MCEKLLAYAYLVAPAQLERIAAALAPGRAAGAQDLICRFRTLAESEAHELCQTILCGQLETGRPSREQLLLRDALQLVQWSGQA